jgi:hypothetical protein
MNPLGGRKFPLFPPRRWIRTPSGRSLDPAREEKIINDIVEARDGRVWLFERAVADLADPKDTILNPETLVPPQLANQVEPQKESLNASPS